MSFDTEAFKASLLHTAAISVAEHAFNQNASLPALSLPAELYCKIFELLPLMKDRIAASSVCKLWRDFAVADLSLCRSDDLDFFARYTERPDRALLLLLYRASDPPFTVDYRSDYVLENTRDGHVFATGLNENMSRIRTLRLEFRPSMRDAIFSGVDMTAMEELVLTCSSGTITPHPQTVLPAIRGQGMPRLRHLEVSGIHLPK